jgi:hypothetical protein
MVATMISFGLFSKTMDNAGAGKIPILEGNQTSLMAGLQAVSFWANKSQMACANLMILA